MTRLPVIIRCYVSEDLPGAAADSIRRKEPGIPFDATIVNYRSRAGTSTAAEQRAVTYTHITLVQHMSNQEGGAARSNDLKRAPSDYGVVQGTGSTQASHLKPMASVMTFVPQPRRTHGLSVEDQLASGPYDAGRERSDYCNRGKWIGITRSKPDWCGRLARDRAQKD